MAFDGGFEATPLSDAGRDASEDTDGAALEEAAPDNAAPDAAPEAAPDADSSTDAWILEVVSTLDLGGDAPVLSICARGGTALVGRALAVGPTPELVIVNVDNPQAPTVIGSLDVETSIRALVLEGWRAYAATSDPARELLIADVRNPASTTLIGGFDVPGDTAGLSLDAAGNRVVLGLAENPGPELIFLNTTDPASAVETLSYEVGADVNDVATNATVAYVATSDPDAEFQALSYSDNAAYILRLGSYDADSGPARALDVNEGRVYVVAGNSTAGELLVFEEGKAATLIRSQPLSEAPADVLRYSGMVLNAGTDGVLVTTGDLETESELLLEGGASAVGLDRHSVLVASATAGRIYIARSNPAPRVEDLTSDGIRTLSVLGDSNSKRADGVPTWVDELALRLPADWRVFNHAEPYASTYFAFDPTYPNAWEQVEAALAEDNPDVFALSFVSNDLAFISALANSLNVLLWEGSVDDPARRINDLRARAGSGGAAVFVALGPPHNAPLDDPAHELEYELNHRLRNDVDPAFIIDFFSTMVPPDDYYDQIHLAPTGQSKRATEALLMLVP